MYQVHKVNLFNFPGQIKVNNILFDCGKDMAKKYDLLLSGGSDFHGKAKPGLELGSGYGKLFVPYTFLEEIKQARCEK